MADSAIAANPVPLDDFWGYVASYDIVYVDSDLAADNSCFPFALSQGYHLGTFSRAANIAGCPDGAPPDDSDCWGPLEFQEVPMTTPLTLELLHNGTVASPPPGGAASPPPEADGGLVSTPSSGPDGGGVSTPGSAGSGANP